MDVLPNLLAAAERSVVIEQQYSSTFEITSRPFSN
jgi:hypothetical protein